jgi:DNA-binding transcriptional LysR family regulator
MLEQWAGTSLLLRSTRRLGLTPAGERHLAIWREILLKLDDIETGEHGAALRGEIVFTAPELFGRMQVLPVVERFLREHPGVSIRALLDNRIVSLVGEGVDAAIRLAHLPDSTLTATKIGQVRAIYCASPEYLEERGQPETLRDLEHHTCIGLSADSDAELWLFRASTEQKDTGRSVRVHTRLSVNNQAAVIDAALRGQGIICAQSYQVVDHLVAGRLVSVLKDFAPPPIPAHVVFQASRAKRGAVRAFLEQVVIDLKRELQRIEARISRR